MSEGRRFSGCGAGLGKPVRVGGLASALGTKPGLSVGRADLGGGVRVRTVPLARPVGQKPGEWMVGVGSVFGCAALRVTACSRASAGRLKSGEPRPDSRGEGDET